MAMNLTGSSWVTKKCLDQALARLKTDITGLNDLIDSGEVVYYEDDQLGDMFTLPEIREREIRIAQNVIRLKLATPRRDFPSESEADLLIEEYSKKTGIILCDEQEDAVKKSLRNQIVVITGGPGTGKTCTLKAIIECLRALGYVNIRGLAPTGKAASRMTESTGLIAETIHSKLSISEDCMVPVYVSGDVVIVDEISMLDEEVADVFFSALNSGIKVILVGDIDQLPSVGIGSVLRDFLESNVIAYTRLIKTYRQGNESLIFTNMKKIRDGKYDLEVGDDFQIAVPTKEHSAVDEMITIYMSEYNRLGGNDSLCLLTPFRNRKRETSSEAMNDKLQAIINPDGNFLKNKNGEKFKKGDPVMQTKNRKECANGDVGRVIEVTSAYITVKYDRETVRYDADDLDQLTLAYAMSIHKSQGSEYQSVITCLLNEHSVMLQRNLLYTAVTRAKKNCFLVCEPEAVKKAVVTVADGQRVTQLVKCLRYENFCQSMNK